MRVIISELNQLLFLIFKPSRCNSKGAVEFQLLFFSFKFFNLFQELILQKVLSEWLNKLLADFYRLSFCLSQENHIAKSAVLHFNELKKIQKDNQKTY